MKNNILRNVLAVVLGIVGGSIVNSSLVSLGHKIFPLPEGTDTTTFEGLQASMPYMQPEHFIFPWLAHALGTFAGALLAGRIAASRKMVFSLVIGCWFLVGGIVVIFLLPSPIWFTAIDLVFAYIPMAWLAGKLVK